MAISLCASNVVNTGPIQCDVGPGIAKKIFIWNNSADIVDVTGDLFQPYFENASKLPKADADKLFVFPEHEDVVDSSEANVEGTLNQGLKMIIREGKPVYTLKVLAGQSLVPLLRKFNNQNVRVLMLDSNNRIWGVKQGEKFVGAQANLFVSGLKFATGQNIEERVVTITLSYLSVSEVNDAAAFGEVTTSSGIIGLIDVNLVETAAHAVNVWHIGAEIPTAEIGQAIYVADTYGAELADALLWKAFTGAPIYGTPLSIDSVTYEPANKGWVVTFDAVEYAALANGTKIKLQWVDPITLEANDVDGLESNFIILTK